MHQGAAQSFPVGSSTVMRLSLAVQWVLDKHALFHLNEKRRKMFTGSPGLLPVPIREAFL